MTFEEMKNSEIEKYKGQYQQDELERIKPLIDSIVKRFLAKTLSIFVTDIVLTKIYWKLCEKCIKSIRCILKLVVVKVN